MQVSDIYINLKELDLSPSVKNIEEEVRATMSELKTKYPNETYPQEMKIMMNYLQGLPGGKMSLNELFEFVNDRTIRNWVQPMLLGNLDISTIYITTSVKTDKIYEEGTYQAFQRYFFDLSSFTSRDKYLLVEEEKLAKLKDLYNLALEYDKAELLWKMGFTPELPIDQIVKSVAAESLMRMKNATDDDKAARLGTLALKASDKLKEINEDEKKDFEMQTGIKFEILKEKPKFKTLKELEG